MFNQLVFARSQICISSLGSFQRRAPHDFNPSLTRRGALFFDKMHGGVKFLSKIVRFTPI